MIKNNYMRLKIITCTHKILFMIKIITCAHKILLMIKIITCALKKMEKETYCLVCRKYTKNNNPKVVRNRQNRLIVQSNCVTCGSKKSRFIKEEQQVMGILSNLGIKTPLSEVPLLNILF